jgi:transaldolase
MAVRAHRRFIGIEMNAARQLHEQGQRLWLDNITRQLVTGGTLSRYIEDCAVTGLTSNPSIFNHAIGDNDFYDEAIREQASGGISTEALFFALSVTDAGLAADLFRTMHDATAGSDGWVSLEVSPLLAAATAATIEAAAALHAQARRPNLFVKIPGTPEGLPAIEESIFAGIPVNITLLFSREHYLAAAAAYMRGIERRIAAGRVPVVESVASIFVSRWDSASNDKVPRSLHNRLGIAMAGRTYSAYQALLKSPRWLKLHAAGARPQRLLWASTGTKDAAASDVLYVEALAAAETINTLPESTLLAFADHGQVATLMSADCSEAESVIAQFARHGVDDAALAGDLQIAGVASFVRSWRDLMQRLAKKVATQQAGLRRHA